MGDLAEVLDGGVECAVLHPGFGGALLAQAVQEAAGAALEVERVGGFPLAEVRKNVLEGVAQAAGTQIVGEGGVAQ